MAERMQGMSGSIVREILKLTQQPDIISMAGGLPSPDSFPVAQLRQITADLFAGDTSFLQYGTTEGIPELRSHLAEWVSDLDIKAAADNTLILTGSQQGIDLICKVMMNPGDTVIVERPTYLAALQIFRMYQVNVVDIPGDEEGMDIKALERTIKKTNAKMVYTIPTFQNPTGISWTLERRKALADLADKYKIVVVEDDPYGRLRYSGENLSAVTGLNGLKQTIYLGSFSKVVSPGLRIGYAIGPQNLIRSMTIAKQTTDLHSSNLSQQIVLEFIKRGYLKQHIPHICAQYAAKRDCMLAALSKYFPAQAHWTHPDGGLFIWATLPEEISSTRLLDQAVAEKVAFIPGKPFYADGSGDNCLRLNFSNSTPTEIENGLARLGRVIAKELA